MADVNFDKNNFDFDKVEVEHFKKALNWLAAGNKWPSIRDAEVFHIKFDDKNYPLKVVFDQACYIAETGNPDPDFKNLGYTTREVLTKLKKDKFAEIDIVKDREKEIRTKFRFWLGRCPNKKNGTLLADRTMDQYLSYANAIYKEWGKKQSSTIPESIWGVLDPSVVDMILNDCKEDLELSEIDMKWNDRSGSNGLSYYKEFLLENGDDGEYRNGVYGLNGENIILYGVPGSGKSHAIKEMIGKLSGLNVADLKDKKRLEDRYNYLQEKGCITRVVFHPDYTYSDFTGQILPKIVEGVEGRKVEYEFRPGPFTRILKKALVRSTEPFFLIIEEINRGNSAAIFGDLFQLLDRKNNGNSEYQIDNHEIQEVVHGKGYTFDKKIYIPANLWLLATMNTSDQNVFPLDTAFQRRWEMELIPNEFDPAPDKQGFTINGTGVTWKEFADVVNEKLEEGDEIMSGDKRLGAWFILPDSGENFVSKKRFANKVLKYLWDDAFKFNRSAFFNTDDYRTLEDVIEKFVGLKDGQGFGKLFKTDIFKQSTVKTEAKEDTDGIEVANA